MLAAPATWADHLTRPIALSTNDAHVAGWFCYYLRQTAQVGRSVNRYVEYA